MKKNKIVKLISLLVSWAVVISYALIGAIAHIWHPTWLLFFLIPIVEELCACIINKDANRFPIVLIVASIYLTLGFMLGIWHPLWVIFLLIPLYYTTVNMLNGKEEEKEEGEEKE